MGKTVNYIETDCPEGVKRHWFALSGDFSRGNAGECEINGEFAILDDGTILDSDGCPIDDVDVRVALTAARSRMAGAVSE